MRRGRRSRERERAAGSQCRARRGAGRARFRSRKSIFCALWRVRAAPNTSRRMASIGPVSASGVRYCTSRTVWAKKEACRPIAQPHPASTSTRPGPPPAPSPPPPLHLLPRLVLEGGHGLPAQLLRGRRHLALRVIPRRLPICPLVAPHTHIPHCTPRLVRLPPQHTPSPSVRGPTLSQSRSASG